MKVLKILFCWLAVCIGAAPSSTSDTKYSIKFQPGKKVGAIQSDLIREASGIVASRKNAPVLWLHNDSGNSPKIYAINPKGELLGVFAVTGSRCRDWEDIAIGPGPQANIDYLYIGDIGDNSAAYPSVTIYRVPEPVVDSNSLAAEHQTEPAERIELIYPDGPKDAETLLVDSVNRDIYIISKRNLFSRVYLAPYPQSTDKPTKMFFIAILPWGLATGGDVSPDGKLVVVRGLTSASIWSRPEGRPLWKAFSGDYSTIELMPEPQGEAICFDATGSGLYTTSEKSFQPIYYFQSLNLRKETDR